VSGGKDGSWLSWGALLPNQFYHNDKGDRVWLRIKDLDPGLFTSFPATDTTEPYEEIYARTHQQGYWSMIHEEWIQPSANDAEITVCVGWLKGELS
jgi:hypothetical protein